jgi:hypothetical protein
MKFQSNGTRASEQEAEQRAATAAGTQCIFQRSVNMVRSFPPDSFCVVQCCLCSWAARAKSWIACIVLALAAVNVEPGQFLEPSNLRCDVFELCNVERLLKGPRHVRLV